MTVVDVLPGESVLTVLGAANHDPTVFDDPHALRLERPNANRHLAFGAGIHYCLGASLARLEASIAITSLIRRFPSLELVGEPHVARSGDDPRRRAARARRQLLGLIPFEFVSRSSASTRTISTQTDRRGELRVLQQMHEAARVPAAAAALDDVGVELVDERR